MVNMYLPVGQFISCRTKGRRVTMPEPRGRKSLKHNTQRTVVSKLTTKGGKSKIKLEHFYIKQKRCKNKPIQEIKNRHNMWITT